jgi:NADH dehydrogenase FAD-containing subunit
MNDKTKILILGSGFGGLYTALHLEKTPAKDFVVELIFTKDLVQFLTLRSTAVSTEEEAIKIQPQRRAVTVR